MRWTGVTSAGFDTPKPPPMTLRLDMVDLWLRISMAGCSLLILLMLIAILRNETRIRARLDWLAKHYSNLAVRMDILDWLTKENPYWCGSLAPHGKHGRESPPNSGVFWVCIGGPPSHTQGTEEK